MSPAHLPRVKAPRRHGEQLVHPPLSQISDLLAQARDGFSGASILERPLTDLRVLARREISLAARDYLRDAGEPVPEPTSGAWFVGGHQPELFHPGVWMKNFLLHALSRGHRGVALNLVVDSDLAKSTKLRVPAGNRTAEVPFDEPGGKIPFEERTVRDEGIFHTVVERMGPIVREWPFHPWIGEVWDELLRTAVHTPLLGERIVRARRSLERSIGLTPSEIPLSAACRTESFAWFACSLLADPSGFAWDYNAAVGDYRRRHGLKSQNHPVPDLAVRGDAIESPFWTWTVAAPQRRRLFVVRDRTGAQLFADETPLFRLDGEPREWIAAWPKLEASGIKIRTRALTTTLFARLLLADLFVHGIGGGKYDEVTDTLIRRRFGLTPPPFLIATATLLLPFPATTSIDVANLRRLERDLWFNPQRHLETTMPEAITISEMRSRALAMPQTTHDERVARFRALFDATANLRPFVRDQIEAAKHIRLEAETAQRRRDIESSREYPFCVYPEEMLRSFMTNVVNTRFD